MIPARPTTFHRALLAGYFERRMRRRFSRVVIRGLERLLPWDRDGNGDGPLLLVANHSSWWDAVLPIVISRGVLKQDAYGMMDAEQLGRYRFFSRAGMFSVNRASARSAMATLQYGAALLRDRSRVLWVFPQGRIVSNDARPIVCETGTAHLARMLGHCAIAPVAFRYEVGADELPSACASIGEAIRLSPEDCAHPRELTGRIANMMESELDSLRAAMIRGAHLAAGEFRTIISGAESVNQRWDRARLRRARH